ncbi:B-cell receptor-associated protein 31 [Senna tora]|uniref:Endoplasmic reticulum transmembrane protein n=1 Tax=Senna tora TaxID=362788 RepID=A0A834W625_9FABA|nr:B-cell receptor-associated protein 31 [Senna tora]
MIPLWFIVILSETAMIMVLLFKSPLRKMVIMGLDRVKRGRGPVTVKTVGGTVLVMLSSSVYSCLKIQNRMIENGAANPTDQVLMAKHLLEATLMGAVLFLALMVDRIHHYIKELPIQRKRTEAIKKEVQALEDEKVEKIKALKKEKARLRAELKGLESELQSRTKNVNVAEASAVALRKQSEGFLLEYERIFKENQNLRNQLQSLDYLKLSRSCSKKNV